MGGIRRFSEVKPDKHSDNVHALDEHGNDVFVLDVKSGRNNYRCKGCKKEVLAIHRSDVRWQPYFRHHVTDVDFENKCTYRDETYRHKIAKEILQRIKQVKVPGLKKLPPKGIDGEPMLIAKPRIITAATVLVERQFYEGEDNKVHYGPDSRIKVRENIIKPDITFLNSKNIPILFIEVVATHQPDEKKLVKIKHLGIDTIQIKVPKDSKEEIEKSFYTVKHTKWVFNHELESTTYIPVSGSYNPGASNVDEYQDGIYEETLACRRSQIGNLIRAVNRCLRSRYYTEIEESARRTIDRTREITEDFRKRNERLEQAADKEAFELFGEDIKRVEDRREKVNQAIEDFEEEQANLERRYLKKRETLEREIEEAQSRYKQRVEKLGGKGKSFDERKADIRRERDGRKEIIKGIEDDIKRIRREFDAASKKNRKDIRSMGEDYRKKIQPIELNAQTDRARIERAKDQIEKQERETPERFKQLENELRESYAEGLTKFAQAIRERSAEGDRPEFTQLRRIIGKHQQYQSISDLQESIKRVRAAREWFETAPWTSWG